MERSKRLAEYWNWLPSFRAVAELEHLTLAAESLRVSPSALSRSVHLLEERLAFPLFVRQGRRLILTQAGQELLATVRQAMRLLDDSVSRADRQISGAVRLTGPSGYELAYLVPTLARLRAEHPTLLPEIVPMPADPVEHLLTGVVDVAILEAPRPSPHLRLERLQRVDYAIYCGASHPLHRELNPTPEAILQHVFVGPSGDLDDPWPAHLPRTIGFRVSHLHVASELCASGACLAVLPSVLAADPGLRGRLRRLPFPELPSVDLCVAYRTPVSSVNNTSVAVQTLKRIVDPALAERSAPPG